MLKMTLFFISLILFSSCNQGSGKGSNQETNNERMAAYMEVIWGNYQHVKVNTNLPDRIKVKIYDTNHSPLPGVQFRLNNQLSTVSDDKGVAEIEIYAGLKTGIITKTLQLYNKNGIIDEKDIQFNVLPGEPVSVKIHIDIEDDYSVKVEEPTNPIILAAYDTFGNQANIYELDNYYITSYLDPECSFPSDVFYYDYGDFEYLEFEDSPSMRGFVFGIDTPGTYYTGFRFQTKEGRTIKLCSNAITVVE